jgi:hypothetical protein
MGYFFLKDGDVQTSSQNKGIGSIQCSSKQAFNETAKCKAGNNLFGTDGAFLNQVSIRELSTYSGDSILLKIPSYLVQYVQTYFVTHEQNKIDPTNVQGKFYYKYEHGTGGENGFNIVKKYINYPSIKLKMETNTKVATISSTVNIESCGLVSIGGCYACNAGFALVIHAKSKNQQGTIGIQLENLSEGTIVLSQQSLFIHMDDRTYVLYGKSTMKNTSFNVVLSSKHTTCVIKNINASFILVDNFNDTVISTTTDYQTIYDGTNNDNGLFNGLLHGLFGGFLNIFGDILGKIVSGIIFLIIIFICIRILMTLIPNLFAWAFRIH